MQPILMSALALLAASAHAAPYDFPDDGGWYSLLALDTGETLCRVDVPGCDVPPGEYLRKNWTSGATVMVTVAETETCILDAYTFPDDGNWYSLLDADSGASLCRIDQQPCRVPSGDYVLHDWTSGTAAPIFITSVDACGLGPSDELAWSEPELALAAYAGTAFHVPLEVVWPGASGGEEPTFESDQGLFSLESGSVRPLGGDAYSLVAKVEVPAEAVGEITGDITLSLDGSPIGAALPFVVTIIDPDAVTIPEGMWDPSTDLIVPSPYSDETRIAANELLVQISLYDPADHPDSDTIARHLAATTGGVLIGSDRRLDLYQVRYPDLSNEEFIDVWASLDADFDDDPDAPRVAFNFVDVNPETVIPDDSGWDDWDVASPDGNNRALEQIDAPGAWDITTGSASVRVAVIDTGHDGGHTDLAGNVSRGSLRTRAALGHGAHVSGTACAAGDNARGISGVAWDCDLRLYLAGDSIAVTLSRMADAVDDGARIVNISLNYLDRDTCFPEWEAIYDTHSYPNALFRVALDYGLERDEDVLWVMAAGNDCGSGMSRPAPGELGQREDVITVAAVDAENHLAAFSNRGYYVSVAAPGVDVHSTLPQACTGFGQDCSDRYGTRSGTSSAAPQVAGVAALVLSIDPSRSAAEVKDCIVSGSEFAGAPISGETFHVLNAPAALTCSTP